MTPVQFSFEITPLTHSGRNQRVYVRREEVTRQLEELSTSPEEILARRIKVEQEEQPESIKSEALVFLYRKYLGTRLAEDIYITLSLRIERILRKVRWNYSLSDSDFEDFLQEINFQLLEKISSDTDEGDYAQVSFGEFVKALSQNQLRKIFAQSKRDKTTDSIDEKFDDDEAAPARINLQDMNLSSETKILIAEAINSIAEPYRTVWVMYHQMGYQIESKDKNEKTISSHYDRTGRTIRNWLAEADGSLEKWNRGLL